MHGQDWVPCLNINDLTCVHQAQKLPESHDPSALMSNSESLRPKQQHLIMKFGFSHMLVSLSVVDIGCD